jgi:hypothetical protein
MPDAVKNLEYDLAEPLAGALIQSLRAFGYDLSTAIADLIDNSITAGANSIDLEFFWNGAQSYFLIADDGVGMTEERLIQAMRPGSQSPLEKRDDKDLGRFGLGLKTASFSQAKKLTVASKRDGCTSVRCWDLDFVTETGQWCLLRSGSAVFVEQILPRLHEVSQGTIVVWEAMDRVIPEGTDTQNSLARDQFYERMEHVSRHLEMTFHRFLRPEPGQKALKIRVQGHELKAWDPYLSGESAHRLLTEESVRIFGTSLTVVPHILPHKSKLKPEVFDRAAGPKGWNAQQGFYVYRNRRLLVAGSWLGLKSLRQDEHCKLARILIDIPNHMDDLWGIDVKKSRAYPPLAVRDALARIATKTRSEAEKVYRSRGGRLQTVAEHKIVTLWESHLRNRRVSYRLNRGHPLVKAACDAGGEAVSDLLRFIEETVPASRLTLSDENDSHVQAEPFESEQAELLERLRRMYRKFRELGLTALETRQELAATDPFHRFPALIGMLEEED